MRCRRCEPLPEQHQVKSEKEANFLDFLKSLTPMTVQPPAADTPTHPEVDTMEFRPSDFHLGDFLSGLPF